MNGQNSTAGQEGIGAGRAVMVAVGGGKGGIGKSLLTANLGVCLAKVGKQVVLVDADLGGANLHTCLGLDLPSVSMGDFVQRRVERLEQVVVDTGIEGLGLISGAQDFFGSANIKYTQKLRMIRQLRQVQTDVLLLDLGSGTSFNVLDFFLSSHLGVIVVVPEPTSLENSYRFLRSAFYRMLFHQERNRTFRQLLELAMVPNNERNIRTPYDLIREVEKLDPERGDRYRAWLGAFRPLLVVNQVRNDDDRELGQAMTLACRKYLGIELDYVGYICYSDEVWQGVRNRSVLLLRGSESDVVNDIWRVAREIEKRLEGIERDDRARLEL